jgi:histidine triad (HIT) family protein
MNDCAFCAIIAGHTEASVVTETERVVAFLDIAPITPGHTLVVPRQHAPRLADLDPEDGCELFRLGQGVAGALYAGKLRAEGVNLFVADGEAAGQEVFHVHLHVFPRFRGDGFDLRLPPDRLRSREELEQVAAPLREVWR